MAEIYSVRIPEALDPQLLRQLLLHVSPARQKALNRMRHKEDVLRGLFAGLLARRLIMDKTGLQNSNINFTIDQYGKPSLTGHQDLHFNLSHSGSWVTAAIDSVPVGVDVEQIDPYGYSITPLFFSPQEQLELKKRKDKLDYIFDVWTIKESYIKARGKRLTKNFDILSVDFPTNGAISITHEGKLMSDVYFALYSIHPNYKTAICCTKESLPRKVINLAATTLIETFT